MVKKNNWFFNKNLMEEINEFTNDEIEQEAFVLEDQTKKISHLIGQLEHAQQRQEDFQTDNRRLSQELEELKIAQDKLIQTQQVQQTEYENEKQAYEQEVQALKEQLETQKQLFMKKTEGNKEKEQRIQVLTTSVAEKQKRIDEQYSEIQALNEQLERLHLEKTQPKQAYKDLEAAYEKKEKERLKVEQQLKELKKQHLQVVQQYTEAIQQVNQLNDERAELRNQMKQKVIEHNQLEERVIVMGEIKKENLQLDQEREVLKKNFNEETEALNEKLKLAQEEINRLEEELHQVSDSKELLEKNTLLERQLTEKETQITELKERLERVKETNENEELPQEEVSIEQDEVVENLTNQVEKLTQEQQKIHMEKAEISRRLQMTEEVLQQKNQQLHQFEELLVKKTNDAGCESEAFSRAQTQIDDLKKQNEALKQEVVQSQLEIGEVLFTAKKQANRTVEEAQTEAKYMIDAAELEVESISNRARKILMEVSESKETVIAIYEDLEKKVEQLTKGTIILENQN